MNAIKLFLRSIPHVSSGRTLVLTAISDDDRAPRQFGVSGCSIAFFDSRSFNEGCVRRREGLIKFSSANEDLAKLVSDSSLVYDERRYREKPTGR